MSDRETRRGGGRGGGTEGRWRSQDLEGDGSHTKGGKLDMPEMRPWKASWSQKTTRRFFFFFSSVAVTRPWSRLEDQAESRQLPLQPTCRGCPALGSGHPGASCQLVL